MAADYIAINKVKNLGNETVRLANRIDEARELAETLNAIAGHQWDTADYSVLEAQFGLPTGQGANFLTLLANTLTALDGSSLTEFVARIARQ